MTTEQRKLQTRLLGLGLETVFPSTSQWFDRIVYDIQAGRYYDRYTDIYLSDDEWLAMAD